MNRKEAKSALEDVIDTLIEVGNGTTDEMLHKAADKLLEFRDYFNQTNIELSEKCKWMNDTTIQNKDGYHWSTDREGNLWIDYPSGKSISCISTNDALAVLEANKNWIK